MSGLEVIGGISAIISILDASIKIYDSARKDMKLSAAFEVVRRRLPILLDTLEACKSHLESRKDSISEEAFEALEKSLDACDTKALNLRVIFEKVVPGETDTREKRYLKVLQRLGKGNKVEELMRSITEDVQLIVNHNAVQSANQQQNLELENIIKEISSVDSSTPHEDNLGMTFTNNGGTQHNYVHKGYGAYHVNSGNGTQYIAERQSFVIKPQANFSYRGLVGILRGQAPYIPSELFIGRGYELDEIAKVLHPDNRAQKQRRLVLGGIGGIGKTQLAIAYSESGRGSYDSVLWLNAVSETALQDSFRMVAGLIFDVDQPSVLEDKEIERRIHQWLCTPKNTGWLLIFDNYDDPTQFKIDRYYPPASHGDIIVTTRRPDLVTGTSLHIKPFQNIEDSLAILQTRSKRENVHLDPHAKRLAERLAGLPLALATAGTYLQRSIFTFERYLREYEKRWNLDPDRSLELQEYQERTLYTTWDLSYFRIEKENPDAAKMLKILAYFDNHRLWYEHFHVGIVDNSPEWLRKVLIDDFDFEKVMRILTDYYFLDVDQTFGSWSMHNCVHDWTLAALNKNIDVEHYWYAFDCISASIKNDDSEDFAKLSYAPLAAHATRLVQQHLCKIDGTYKITPCRLDQASQIGNLLQRQLHFLAAEQMYQRALTGKEKALGADNLSTLDTVHNIGILYRNQGKLDQAEQLYQRVLAGREKALGMNHPSTLRTINNLGILYRKQAKLDQAEQMYQRALAGYEKVLVEDDRSILQTMNSLSSLYQNQCKLDQAEHMYQRALSKELVLGENHMSTLDTVYNLGVLYWKQGKLEQAEPIYKQVLARYEKALGTDHPSSLTVADSLGVLYRQQGKLEQSEQMHQRALAGKEKALGVDHTSTLASIMNIGTLYSEQGKLDLAEQMYQQALSGKEKVLGSNHSSTLDTVTNFGVLYWKQGKLEQAEKMYKRALAGYKEALGENHPSTLNAVHNLGTLGSKPS